jgi:hypothetical protein
MNKTLIKSVTNVSAEGISFELTSKAQMNGRGLATKNWYVSWDKIGSALFGDQYSDSVTVAELNAERSDK